VPVAQPNEHRAWADGSVEATCARGRDHVAPDEDCRCGVYAFGSVADITRQYGQGQRILAVVACHGKIIAGTKGLRAQRAHIVALWLSPRLSPTLRAKVVAHYPRLPLFSNTTAMLAEFPVTRLETYDPPRRPLRRAIELTAFVAVLLGLGAFAYDGRPVGEMWQALALLLALSGGAISLCASLGIRAIGSRTGAAGFGVMVICLALAVRGMPAGLAAVPLLVITTCYVAVGLWQRVAVRWGPLCDGLVPFTPPLPTGLAAADRALLDPRDPLAWYFFDDDEKRGSTFVCARYRHSSSRNVRHGSGALADVDEAVFLVAYDPASFIVTRCRRQRPRTWRAVSRQVCSRAEVEAALGMAIPQRPSCPPGNRRIGRLRLRGGNR
jgi:hypothetical protein